MTEFGRATAHDNPALAFLRARWRGEVPPLRLFWRDMVLVASTFNVLASGAAMLLFSLKMPLPIVLAAHFAVVPYNLFLILALWQTAERRGDSTVAYLAAATVWLALVSIL
jgi:hypothetical protein